MRRLALVMLAVAVALSASGCSKRAVVGASVAAANPTASVASATVDPAFVSAINQFGFDLLAQRDAAEKPGKTTVISPLSVHIALGMTANGADGDTLAEMRRTLHLDGMEEADSNQAYADLIGRMNASSGLQLDVANSLWIDEGFPAKEAFLSADRRFFGAELRTLDLQAPSAPAAINGWVEENTGGRIEEIVSKESLREVAMELVNAAYFKADWATPFKSRATRPHLFGFADGSMADVEMLSGTESWRHLMNADYEAIELPYAGGSASMIVVKTSPLSSRSEGAPTLTAETFGQLRSDLAAATLEEGSLELPKLEVEWSGKLADDLQALSMRSAFDGKTADFTRMSDAKPLWISSVTHKTYLRVDEKGTEAAAATEVGMTLGAAPSQPAFRMTVDSPYLIAIVDNQTDTILLLATIRDPRSK